MQWQLTTHAIERYIDRIAPALMYEQAAEEMRHALGQARRDREAERRPGLRGQVFAAAPNFGGRDRVLTHFIVLPPSDPTARGRRIVTTCWPSDFAGDEIAELRTAERAAVAVAPPAEWRESDDPLPRDDVGWGQLVGRIETARMRALAHRVELAQHERHRSLLLDLAMSFGGEVEARVLRWAPELAAALRARRAGFVASDA